MSIASRITSIEEHIKESYQELEGIGIDTTGVNNNLENIPKLIDGYWETLPKVTGEGTSITLDNTKEGKMKIDLKGNTSQEGTPTPETPQDIHVVTGDNTINICGKNLLSTSFELGTINAYGLPGGATNRARTGYEEVQPNKTYIFSSSNSNIYFVPYFYDESYTFISFDSGWKAQTTTITTPSNTKYLRLLVKNNLTDTITLGEITQPQIEQGNQATIYEPYKSASYPITLPEGMFLGWIPNTDYRDKIDKSTGKNLFENVVYKDSYIIDSKGTETGNALGCIWKKIKVKPNTTYTLSYTSIDYSFGQRVSEYNSSEVFIQRNSVSRSPYTFTTTSTTEYINLSGLKTDTNIMINEGTTALDYEPYGNGDWYLEKKIGKKVFNGTENWGGTTFGNYYRVQVSVDDIIGGLSANDIDLYSNYFYGNNGALNSEQAQVGMMAHYRQNTNCYFVTNLTSYQDFKTWLSTHNTTFYYRLNTPTYTEITDSTLLSQLNALAKSYASQTNISQENNDLASILNATALEEME